MSFTSRPGAALAAFGDITQLLLLALASTVMVANAVSNGGQTRLFWSLMAVGCFMWTANQAMWTFYEVVLGRALPDPFVGDVILFLHVVPLMAAALRPHRALEEHKLYSSTLNFLMLLVWWMFLYAFIVFPDEYVVLDKAVYSRSYDLLYLVENLALLAVLGMLASSTGGAWKRIYWNLFVASATYTLSSEAMNAAIARREGDEVVLEFSDSGPGIREAQRVFDPFYTTKPIGKGTGLGLSATYGVLQDHQGQITCHNRPEGGAVFVLRFPAAAQTVPASTERVRA